MFPSDIGRPTLGVKLLGGAVSQDAGFISSLAVKRTSRAVELMSLLPSLWDPQSELLLLRSCMGVAKLLFGLRTCQPMYIGEAVSIFDNGLRRAIEAIVVCGGPFFGDFQWRLASLPIRFGGLGLCSAEDVSTYAFVASRAQSWSLQDHILQGCGIDGADSDYGYALDRVRIEIVKSLGVSFDLSPRQKAVVECLRAPRAQNFLTVIPIEGLGQHMSALEYRTILKYRLMIPLFPVDEPCPVCRKVCLDSFGEHAVHCKELPGFKYRHDLVRDVLYDVLKRAGISSRKEAPVNFLTDPLEGRSTLRPADILVFGWAGGKHACVDLTGVSPLVGLRDNGFVAGQAALKAESSKVAKHEKACLENQHVFIPFAFDTFGFLAPEAEEFLNRVQRGHWKSKSKKKKSYREEDDLSQPWVCKEVDRFTPRIRYFDFPKTRMPSHIKTNDGSEDPEDHLKIFQAAAKTERWAMPTWCHMFNSTLTGNTRVWGEVAASNHERKKTFPPWKQHEGSKKQNFKKGGFRNQQRSERKHDRFSLLTKILKEIFALDKGKFKALPPMTTPVKKQMHAKFCEFHGEVGHNTDECMHLKKHIEEKLKAGKLPHLIKELKQNNEKEQPKVAKKEETFGKDKALAILMV
ncbi:hypothetical protein Tco_1097223 [Tanacetum coccineum]